MGKCKAPVETYSRIVGYFRPVQHWNTGKKSEFKDRVPFKMSEGMVIGKSMSPVKPGFDIPHIDELEKQAV